MKALRIYIPYIISLFALSLILSCGNGEPSGAERRILVIHSWDSNGEEGSYFQDKMKKEFSKNGIKAEIHHIYANMCHTTNKEFTKNYWPVYLDSIKMWKPEIILLNDDPILTWVFKERPCDSLFFNTPVVFAGINGLQRDSVMKYPLMTGFGCNINLPRCIEMLYTITGKHLAFVELDDSEYDEALRKKFHGQLSDTTRFINNDIEHLPDLNVDYINKTFTSKTVVDFISFQEPIWDSNRNPETHTKEEIHNRVKQIWDNTEKACHIQVKHDIYSNSLLDLNKLPQFTCIRAGFNDPKKLNILGGFFTSTEVQIKDQVDYASRILKGTSPASLNRTVHMSDFYMDYNAMKKYSPVLKYEDFSNKYHIINAPMALENPILYYFIIGLLGAIVFAIITFMAQLLYRWRQKGQRELLDDLLYEDKMHSLIFSNSDDTLWHISGRYITFVKEFAMKHDIDSTIMLRDFEKMVHQDTIQSFYLLRNFRSQRGKKTLRFKLSFDKGQTWSWHEMTYTATEDSASSGYLYGIMLNINQKKAVEDTLSEAQMKASEVALKENFLANISHDLRTPLNAITGFSMLLTNKDMTFEEGEREEYGKIIHQNTDMILNMIDSVMQKAQLETGELELIMKPADINNVVNKAYNTNKIIAPTHLEFALESPQKSYMVNIDETRTMQVINNFLSNAFKFTASGSVTLGWRESAEDNMAEIYVRDTGIGVDEEGQKHIFDRYYKETENDKGTGLGLNISKTIIEKQGGKIGMESKLGVGSKFFFKLPHFIQCLIMVLGLGISTSLFTSCTNNEEANPKVNILVLHSYTKSFSNYILFDECIQSTFRSQNINADIKNIYMGLEDPADTGKPFVTEMLDSINRIGWKPDVIMAEGDRVIYDISTHRSEELLSYIYTLPVVFGGLHHPNWNLLRGHKNIVVFYDPIDYATNINLAAELSGNNIVNIELDHFYQDSIIKKELSQTIARPPYVNKIDDDLSNAVSEDGVLHFRDSILVYTTAIAKQDFSNKRQKKDDNEEILMHAWMIPQLSVKMDMFATYIIDKTNKPQFTAVKAGFGDDRVRFLAGYFAGYKTVATDMAMTASRILKGNFSNDMSGKQHEKKYYMDYRAMEKLGLNYYDYSNRFEIVNAPIKYRYPILYYAEHIAIIFFVLVIIVIWLALINYWRERSDQVLISNIKQKANLRILSLNGADSRPLRNEEGVKKTLGLIHPDHKENIQFIEQSLQIEGTHQYDIYADVDQDKKYEWWQLRFVVFKTKGNKQRIDGLVININESKKYEEEMRMAIQLAEEAKRKEDFLMTISHEIRTPLNAVVGFSDVIISLPPEALSQQELDEISFNINDNNAKLAAMIEDILMFSRIESGRIRFVNEEFSASELLEELYNEWYDKIPANVHFNKFITHNNIYIYSDRVRVKYILNQLISNAFKFTKSGNIFITSFYHFKEQKIEFRIEDSGCGISQEKQTAVFNLFWKDNEFVPGLGLGLNISHKLAEGMNAKLEVDSREGYGSVFSLLMEATIKKETDKGTESEVENSTQKDTEIA